MTRELTDDEIVRMFVAFKETMEEMATLLENMTRNMEHTVRALEKLSDLMEKK